MTSRFEKCFGMFSVGDTVRCVNNDKRNKSIKIGETYPITIINYSRIEDTNLIYFEHSPSGFFAWRFEYVE